MAICSDCSEDFDLLTDGETCRKCRELEGKSEVEKLVIRSKGQCKTCSIVYANLENPLCNACCNFYTNADAIPAKVIKLKDVAVQLSSFTKSIPRTQNSSLQKATASRYGSTAPGIFNKAKAMNAQTQAAKENASKIKITSTLWYLKKKKDNSDGFVKIPQVTFAEMFTDATLIWDAFGTILAEAQTSHRKFFPLYNEILRSNAYFYAHESSSKAMRLPDELITKGTVRELLTEFDEKGYISKAMSQKRQIEIRIVCEEWRLNPALADDSLDDPDNEINDSRHSQSTSRGSKRKLSSAAAPSPRDSGIRNVRQSAWRKPFPRFSRDPPMLPCSFTRQIAELKGSTVTFTWESTIEKLEIATDWNDGLQKNLVGKNFASSGFIGQGSSKRVIYARFGGEEYALGQAMDADISAAENASLVRAEFENLVHGEAFRETFEELAIEQSVVIPRFRFNLEGAILGRFTGAGEFPCGLLFADFIATRLLPCSTVDAPIEKFTGNEDCGKRPSKTEELTIAIHAFSHYMILISLGNLVLCDLQGMYDKKQVMCLIDPQSHSSETNSLSRQYWDGGPNAIQKFLDNHLRHCDRNPICGSLGLKTLIVEEQTDPSSPQSPAKARQSKYPRRGPLRHGFDFDE